MNHQIAQPTRHRCRHIFVDGRRCGSASLRHEEFCYYHHTTRRPVANPRTRKASQSTLQLPIPEDRAAIQLSIGLILERLASNSLDPRRAGLLLYGLQIASTNLPPHQQLPAHARPLPEQPLEEVTADPDHGLLAPPADALKTRAEMWDDIYRERKELSAREKNLSEREAALQRERDAIRKKDPNESEARTAERPPAPVLIPPSCFAPPELQARYEARVAQYEARENPQPGNLVLSDVKAQATPRQRRSANRRHKSVILSEVAAEVERPAVVPPIPKGSHRMTACPASICLCFVLSPSASSHSRPISYRLHRSRLVTQTPLHGRQKHRNGMMP